MAATMALHGLQRLPFRLFCRSKPIANKIRDDRQLYMHRLLCVRGLETHFGFETVPEEDKEKKGKQSQILYVDKMVIDTCRQL